MSIGVLLVWCLGANCAEGGTLMLPSMSECLQRKHEMIRVSQALGYREVDVTCIEQKEI